VGEQTLRKRAAPGPDLDREARMITARSDGDALQSLAFDEKVLPELLTRS
jgi:hypothetical protein